MRIAAPASAIAVLLLGASGCSGLDCPAACERVYRQCNAALVSGGVRLTEAQCTTLCEAAEAREAEVTRRRLACVESASCRPDALDACFAEAVAGDGTPGAPCRSGRDCRGGACLDIVCANGGRQRRVCGGAACTASCPSGSACVTAPGGSRCVPLSACR